MRRVAFLALSCLAVGCCGSAEAQLPGRFTGMGFYSNRPPIFRDREDEECSRSRWRPSSVDLSRFMRDEEERELEFRFRERTPAPRSYPRLYESESRFYREPCDGSGRFRQWLLQQGPSGRLRLLRLHPDD